ncbi:hypothetical protein SARC_16146, partial [Sphaeroforma arctica JP610]
PPQHDAVAGQPLADSSLENITDEMRSNIARVRNCIAALDRQMSAIYNTSVSILFDVSLKYRPQELLTPAIQEELILELKALLE